METASVCQAHHSAPTRWLIPNDKLKPVLEMACSGPDAVLWGGVCTALACIVCFCGEFLVAEGHVLFPTTVCWKDKSLDKCRTNTLVVH